VARAKKKSDDALGVRLQWPDTGPTTPIDRRRRRALPRAGATSAPVEATAKTADNGNADPLDRFAERVAVLTEAVEGLRNQLAENSQQVEDLAADLSVRLNTLQEAAEEVGRVRAVLAAQPTEGLERQVTHLIDEVKATRRSVAVSSNKKKALDDDAVERIVRSVVERLTANAPGPKTSRGRRSSVAG